jgi:oligoribonuclease NrnB/cAMP/cGMP phosphodiesterase (DHH superfamily)
MRIVTRPDFDGIVCAVLLRDALGAEITGPVLWVEPNDMQHRLVDVQPGDIIANLSYHENCALWFDHHVSNRIDESFDGVFKLAPSAARLVFDYYKNKDRFKRDYTRLIEAADKIDSADFSWDEVLYPEKYPYTAISTTISSHNRADEPYWNRLVDLLKTCEIEEVLEDPQVKIRINKIVEANNTYHGLLKEHTTVYDHVTVTDFRVLGKNPEGNRFRVFSLFPGTVVNVRVRVDNNDRENVRISIGHSIFNRKCRVNAGLLCSRFGGGGHRGAGACTVPKDRVDKTMKIILDILAKN